MLAELKERIDEVMSYEYCYKYDDCPPAPIYPEDLTLFVELIICSYLNPKNAYYPYYDHDKFEEDYDGNLFQIIYVD